MSAPDWLLIKQVIRIAGDPRWAGGIHRRDLAELLAMSPHDPLLRQSIAIAWRTHRVDVCGEYLVRVPLPGPAAPAAKGRAA